MKSRQLIWNFIQEKIISLFIYEPTDLINFFWKGGGGALLQQIHILLPLTRVRQFRNVNEHLLKSLEVEMKKLRSSLLSWWELFPGGKIGKKRKRTTPWGHPLILGYQKTARKIPTLCQDDVQNLMSKLFTWIATHAFVQRMHMRGCASMHQRVPYGKTQDFNGSEP